MMILAAVRDNPFLGASGVVVVSLLFTMSYSTKRLGISGLSCECYPMNEATEIWQKNFNLATNLTKDVLLRNRLASLTTRLSDMGGSDATGMAYVEERNRIIASIWKDCGHNFSLLTPYFFPSFPKGKPMSMLDRPFNMCMMFSLPFWNVTMRGSRQIGKTTTLGTRVRIIMELFRRYRTMYVAPHTEPLKTFARKYDEISQGFRNPVRDATKFTQNLFFKKYPSNGTLELVRIQTSATPARGKTADEVDIDECLAPYTLVVSGDKLLKIVDLVAGDAILAFDENGTQINDIVRATVCKGTRPTWRFCTSGGKEIVCTSNEKIRTSAGWLYLSQILRARAHLESAEPSTRNVTGGRVHPIPERVQEPKVSSGARATAEGVLPAQAGYSTRGTADHCKSRYSGNTGERGFRGLHSQIPHKDEPEASRNSGALSGSTFIQTGAVAEGCFTCVGRSADMGSCSLVVHGRWLQTVRRPHDLYALILTGGSLALEQMASEPRMRSLSATDEERSVKDLLDTGNTHQVSNYFRTKGSPLHPTDDALQAGGSGPYRSGVQMRVLRGYLSEHVTNESGYSLLLQERVQEGTQSAARKQVGKESRVGGSVSACQGEFSEGSRETARCSRAKHGETAPAICRSGLPETTQRVEEGVSEAAQSRGTPRCLGAATSHVSVLRGGVPKFQGAFHDNELAVGLLRCAGVYYKKRQPSIGGKSSPSERETQNAVDVPILSFGVSKFRATSVKPAVPIYILPESRMCGEDDQRALHLEEGKSATEETIKILTLDGWEDIDSIEYVGEQEVWDIETEKHHTFFANGIAVHNCQLFDPDLEVEVLETLNDSDIQSVLYAGTSTNFDSLLELRYQEGSQSTWQILLDDGNVIDCGDPDAIIPYIGEYTMVDPTTKKKIDPLRGYYRFNNPGALMDRNFSVHIPQIINPDICNSPIKWNALYRTLVRDPAKFVQEKLGIPQESASREITKADLQRMCRPDIVGSPAERLHRCRTGFYKLIVSGVDWGGSDYNQMTKTKISSTVHFILGLTTDNQLHIINVKRHGGMDYKTIINLIAADHSRFNATSIATDFGVGETYHELMRSHPVFNTGRHVIFHYTGPRSSICSVMKGALSNTMNLNRTETLSALFLAISMPEPMILAPSWDEMEDYLSDFLNIHRILQEKEGEGGQRQFLYHRVASKTDDTVHAANFAFSLIRLVYNQILLADNNARALIRAAVLGSDAAAAQGSFVMPSNVNKLIQQANESWKEQPEDWYYTDDYLDHE